MQTSMTVLEWPVTMEDGVRIWSMPSSATVLQGMKEHTVKLVSDYYNMLWIIWGGRISVLSLLVKLLNVVLYQNKPSIRESLKMKKWSFIITYVRINPSWFGRGLISSSRRIQMKTSLSQKVLNFSKDKKISS